MKKTILLMVGLFLLTPLASASVILESGDRIEPSASNTTYILRNTLSFSSVVVESNAPYFNGNIFHIEPDTGVATVTINRLNSMSFIVTATDRTTFTLGGFTANIVYMIQVDGVNWAKRTANYSGVIQFSYNSWSTRTFFITEYGPSGDAGVVGSGGGGIPISGDDIHETIDTDLLPDFFLPTGIMGMIIIILIIVLAIIANEKRLQKF